MSIEEPKIQVLGSGCASCKKLHGLAVEAAKELGLEGEVEYVTDITKIIELGIMQSPAMTVDGKVVLAGYIPGVAQMKEAIVKATGGEAGDSKDAGAGGCSCAGGCC